MSSETLYDICPKCGKIFSHRKAEIIDEVNSGVCRGVDGFYCSVCLCKLIIPNAQLTAAAPDLLEACKGAYRVVRCDPLLTATTAILKAAIAKAEGQV